MSKNKTVLAPAVIPAKKQIIITSYGTKMIALSWSSIMNTNGSFLTWENQNGFI